MGRSSGQPGILLCAFGLPGRALTRLLDSWPSRRMMLGGAVLWAGAMLLSALFALYLRNRFETSHLSAIAVLFAAGGFLGWIAALPVAAFVAHRRPAETRFAAFSLGLGCCTAAITAMLFALEYREFYARWHEPFGTRIWVWQFLFTSASAVYQFAVLGVRLYLPLGFLFLMAASALLTRRMR